MPSSMSEWNSVERLISHEDTLRPIISGCNNVQPNSLEEKYRNKIFSQSLHDQIREVQTILNNQRERDDEFLKSRNIIQPDKHKVEELIQIGISEYENQVSSKKEYNPDCILDVNNLYDWYELKNGKTLLNAEEKAIFNSAIFHQQNPGLSTCINNLRLSKNHHHFQIKDSQKSFINQVLTKDLVLRGLSILLLFVLLFWLFN